MSDLRSVVDENLGACANDAGQPNCLLACAPFDLPECVHAAVRLQRQILNNRRHRGDTAVPVTCAFNWTTVDPARVNFLASGGGVIRSKVLWWGVGNNAWVVVMFMILIASSYLNVARMKAQRRLCSVAECWKCRYSRAGLPATTCPECGADWLSHPILATPSDRSANQPNARKPHD